LRLRGHTNRTGGSKHVLELREGSSENRTVATDLLNDLVERGIQPDRLSRHVLFQGLALLIVERRPVASGGGVDPQMLKRAHADHGG
jgi:hypothetical protein